MAPNLVGGEISPFREVPAKKDKKRLEIFYNGFFYDVTEFVERHPGGNVIKFYTERGEDASQAIEQFHYRSRRRVEAIMKGFKKRPAESHERGLEPKALTRHEALSADFKKLFEELQAEGYFEPSIPHVVLRLLDCLALIVLSYGVFFQCGDALPKKILAAIFVGFAHSRWAFLVHECGHSSLTGRPKLDRFLLKVAGCLVLGMSPVWWNSQHNRHHAMPQRLAHDVDLATLPYVAFHTRTVKDRSKIYRFFVRYQGLFYWTLDLFMVTIAWRFVLHPRYQLHKKVYLEMLLAAPSLVFGFYIGPQWYLLISYWMAFFMAINFALSHSHLEVADQPTHWLEYALTHTANITPSPVVDYWMAYLNYQIEHHLFPTMPQFRQKQISHRVKALAEKYGLPYRVYGYVEACKLAVKNLDTVGKELTSPSLDGFKKDL